MDGSRSYLAIDLGAGSGRVILGRFAAGELGLVELHRFEMPHRCVDGHERWNFARILTEIETGLRAAGAREDSSSIRSVGVDGWGVDFGLLDESGVLLGDPVCYRDPRTDGLMDELVRRMPAAEIYRRTGIQFLPFNTVVQLLAQVASGEWPERAHRLLMVPDLVHRHLSGESCAEFTNATTTQLMNAEEGRWDEALSSLVGVPHDVLPPVVHAGDQIGSLTAECCAATGLENVTVVVPGTHDTASAVAGTPLEDGWAYLSSGTWSLLGVETHMPWLTEAAHRYNFTNEGGVYGTNRFLKNVMGLWLLESCRARWSGVGHERLLGDLDSSAPGDVFLDPDDLRFLHPLDMVAEIDAYFVERGQSLPSEPAVITRVILESLALRYAEVVDQIEEVTGNQVLGVHVVGGGSQNAFLNQATANATGRPVRAGPVEATAVGNLLVQSLADGAFENLGSARWFVARSMSLGEFAPREPKLWAKARERFARLG
jgi:rhamnulokinase